MSEYFDLSDVKMPEGTMVLDNIVSNKVIPSYELSLSLFDKCQLHCDFCFQAHQKDIDLEYIKSIPEKVVPGVSGRLRKFGCKKLHIRMWGGELFHDGIPEYMFDVYKELCIKLKEAFLKEIPDLQIYYNYMSNGAWSKHRDRVLDLLHFNNAIIGFSYDPVGRFPNENLKQLMIENTKFFKEKIGYMNLAMTTTKRNILALINEEDDLLKNYPKDYSLEINPYIPGLDWKVNLPDDDLYYEMWKYLLDHDMFMCKTILNYINPIIYDYKKPTSVCGCKCSDQFSNGCLVRDCIKRTSLLHQKEFYGEYWDNLTEENCQELKSFLATTKRGCMYCENLDRCSWFCSSSILFKEYKATNCPINRLINYVEENKNNIKERLEKFYKENDFNKIFYNPS